MIHRFKNLFYQYMRWCARRRLMRQRPYIIAITGSVGKTSLRMIIYDMIRDQLPQLHTYTSPSNYNSSELGLALSILQIDAYQNTLWGWLHILCMGMWRSVFPPQVAILLLECDVDFKGEMDIELSMFRPDIAIMTEIDLVHTHQLDTLEQVMVEQSKLLRAAQDLCMYPIQLQPRLGVYLTTEMDTVLYSLDPGPQSDAHLTWSGHHYIQQAQDIKAQFQCKSDAWTVHISTNLLGYEHASAMSVGLQLIEIITQRKQISYTLPSNLTVIGTLQPGRYSIFSGKQGSVLIDSTYNAAPKSMRMMIENTIRLRDKIYTSYPIWLALGDMRELGDHTQDCHEELTHWIIAQEVAKVFLVGQSMLEYVVPLLKQSNIDVTHFADSTSLGMYMADLLLTQEKAPVILFKGSQNTIFLEEAVKQCLADPGDITKLCRQGAAWVGKKGF